MSYERGKSTMRGSPSGIADTMQAWMEARAADGIMLTFNQLPHDLDAFVLWWVPELQRPGSVVHGSLRRWLG